MASNTTNFVNIPIVPGGMLGDIVEDELGHHQHQRVENLKQIKKGEWELTPGYRDTLTSLTNAKAGIEVDEDVSGDRFRLIQDGVNILRVDYDISNSPIFGYESELKLALSLPSGVTIASTATLRFFQFRGVIRISGASEPLHYSYVDRTLFDGDDSFTIQKWVLEKAALLHVDNDLEVVETLPIPHTELDLTTETTEPNFALFLKFFYEFDNGQYQLLRLPDASAITSTVFGFPEEIFPITAAYGAHIKLRVPGTALKDNHFNDRITGVGIAFATVPYGIGGTDAAELNAVYKEELEPFFVRNILRIEAPDNTAKIGFALQAVDWDSTSPLQIEISDPDDTWGGVGLGAVFLPAEAGYLGAGVKVKISLASLSIDTTVASVTFGSFNDGVPTTKAVLTLDDDISSVFGITGLKFNVGIVVTLEWQYSSVDGYFTYFGLNLLALGPLYEEFAGIPTGTLQNTPNWEAIQFVAERSYIAGQTGDIGSELISSGDTEEVTLVEDNFTDTNAVLLTAHSMDAGNGWTSPDGDPTRWEIQSNQAGNSASGTNNRVVTESDRSDQITISGSMEIDSASDSVNIVFRHTSSSNEWRLQYLASAAGAEFRLERVISGIVTTRDSAAHTVADGATVTFEIILDGDRIDCDILTPEVHNLDITDSFNNSATKHGFVSGTAGSLVDSFKIVEDVLVPASNAVANDVFTDSNGVALTAHTMSLGNGWTSAGAQWEIQSNEAKDSGAGSGVQVITELNKSDKLIITGKIKINDPDDESRISFRHFLISDEWYFAYSGSNSPTFEIKRVIATVHTVQATQAHTVADGVFVSFQITLDGSSIELKILSPEVYTLTVTDSTHLTETKLAFLAVAANLGATQIDDLVVVETVESFIIESFEEDTVRHSAIGQIDNLPIGNVIQTEVGTTDKILNLAKRDDQLTILKARSISTGGFVGAFYSENIGFTKHGLHSVLGVLSVNITINAEESNEFILIMDEDDLYLYNGNRIVSFFEKVELRQFYRDNVTTSSFMLFDKLHGEILFFLGTEILVWNMHIPEFYIRKTDITPLYGFLDADNFLIIGNAVKQVTFNHGLGVPYDEDISLLIRTKITDLDTPHRFKKLKELHSYISTMQEDITVSLSDVGGAVPGTAIGSQVGVQDHWIVLCANITTSSGDACYGPLSAWANTVGGRESFILGVLGGAVFAIPSVVNGLDVIRLTSVVQTSLRLISSGGNANYTYLHASKGWHAIVWYQTATTLTEIATLWGNGDFGTQADGSFTLFVKVDETFGVHIHRGVATPYINTDTGTQKVKMAAWNFAIVTWEEGTGRDGMRISLNGFNIDFDNTVFSGTPSINPPVLDIEMGVRALGVSSPDRVSEMDIVELGAGNVGLTDVQITDLEDYIESTYAFLGLQPVTTKTILQPVRPKARIERQINYLFKELQVEFSNAADSASLTAQIRDFLLKVERWQKV